VSARVQIHIVPTRTIRTLRRRNAGDNPGVTRRRKETRVLPHPGHLGAASSAARMTLVAAGEARRAKPHARKPGRSRQCGAHSATGRRAARRTRTRANAMNPRPIGGVTRRGRTSTMHSAPRNDDCAGTIRGSRWSAMHEPLSRQSVRGFRGHACWHNRLDAIRRLAGRTWRRRRGRPPGFDIVRWATLILRH